MKILIPGGSGQVGGILARGLRKHGHDIRILSRRPEETAPNVYPWDARSLGRWTRHLEWADAVINLAGRSVNCRYHSDHRREILDSRVQSTAILGEAIARSTRPPSLWLQASTATIYAHRFDAANDEASGILGGDEDHAPATWRFSIDVAKAWERAMNEASTPRTRKVLLRSAMTMSPDRGGIFDVLLKLVRSGLGGRAGNGKQFVSWIHEEDFVRAIARIIDDPQFVGPVNLAAPQPLPHAEFMQTLRSAWGAPLGLPANRLLLEIGAFFMRTETELILKSRRVTPGRLLDAGFSFRFPDWESAAADLCERRRNATEEAPLPEPLNSMP